MGFRLYIGTRSVACIGVGSCRRFLEVIRKTWTECRWGYGVISRYIHGLKWGGGHQWRCGIITRYRCVLNWCKFSCQAARTVPSYFHLFETFILPHISGFLRTLISFNLGYDSKVASSIQLNFISLQIQDCYPTVLLVNWDLFQITVHAIQKLNDFHDLAASFCANLFICKAN